MSNIGVSAGSGCGWTAVSNASFIIIASGTSGAGNGTVTLNVTPNTGAARTGTVTIAGQTVTISQAAAAATTTSTLSFSSTASKGWSSITVSVDGQNIGTLTSYVPADSVSSCVASNGRIVKTVNAGSHTYSASSNTGRSWSDNINVGAGVCYETQLLCPDGDCSVTTPGAIYLPVPVLNCAANSRGNSTITIMNKSSYTLQFVFTGPINTTFSVGSGGTSPTYAFTPGQYQESVSATSASNVQPSKGPVTVPTSSTCTETWVNAS
jgi:hypothetical protein